MTLRMIGYLDRYIIKRIIRCFCAASLVLVNIINLFELVELLRRSAHKQDVKIWTLIEMALLKTPYNWQHFLIFLFFFGALVAFWTLNQNQEITALQACGFSSLRILKSVFFASFFIFLFFLFILDPISCALKSRYCDLENQVFGSKTSLSISGSSLWLRDNNPLTLIHAKNFHLKNRLFWDVKVFVFQDSSYKCCYFAKMARLLDKKWELTDVKFWQKNGEQKKIKNCFLPTSFSIEKIEQVKKSADLVPFLKIKDYQRTLSAHGFSTLHYELYWHKFLAKFILMIALGGFAMIICVRPLRYHRNVKIILLSVGGCFLLHFFQDLLQALSLAKKVSVPLACWGGAVFMMVLNVFYLFYKDNCFGKKIKRYILNLKRPY
jgi:lipopolysaccharide export system permease protein